MPTIIAALVLLTLLVLLNLLLTFGVIRRLREHDQALAANAPNVLLPVGTAVPDFTATTTGGDTVTAASLGEAGSMVLFLAPDCAGCREQLPTVLARLSEVADSPTPIFAFVTRLHGAETPDEDVTELADKLNDAANGQVQVISEPLGGPAQAAFKVSAYPTFYLVGPGGKVAGVGNGITDLPLPEAVHAGR